MVRAGRRLHRAAQRAELRVALPDAPQLVGAREADRAAAERVVAPAVGHTVLVDGASVVIAGADRDDARPRRRRGRKRGGQAEDASGSRQDDQRRCLSARQLPRDAQIEPAVCARTVTCAAGARTFPWRPGKSRWAATRSSLPTHRRSAAYATTPGSSAGARTRAAPRTTSRWRCRSRLGGGGSRLEPGFDPHRGFRATDSVREPAPIRSRPVNSLPNRGVCCLRASADDAHETASHLSRKREITIAPLSTTLPRRTCSPAPSSCA